MTKAQAVVAALCLGLVVGAVGCWVLRGPMRENTGRGLALSFSDVHPNLVYTLSRRDIHGVWLSYHKTGHTLWFYDDMFPASLKEGDNFVLKDGLIIRVETVGR